VEAAAGFLTGGSSDEGRRPRDGPDLAIVQPADILPTHILDGGSKKETPHLITPPTISQLLCAGISLHVLTTEKANERQRMFELFAP
jgi:hypothetical protein